MTRAEFEARITAGGGNPAFLNEVLTGYCFWPSKRRTGYATFPRLKLAGGFVCIQLKPMDQRPAMPIDWTLLIRVINRAKLKAKLRHVLKGGK